MGNTVTISISLDYEQPESRPGVSWAARAGEPIQGRVLVKVNRRMKGDLLSLVAVGKENVNKRGKGAFQLDKPFLHMNETLHDLRGKTVKAGNYIYPFSINLPEAMPSSMTFATNGLQSRIQYKLAAMFGKVRFERDFQVAARPLPPTRVPCFVEPKTEPIKSMGIRTIGSVTFGVMLEDAHIGRGTNLKLAIACRNDSTVDIRRVEIKLVELITLSTKNSAFTKKLTLLQSNDIELPSLIKSKVTRETMNTRRRSYNLHETNFAAIFEALLSDSNTIQIAVPKGARDTYKGGIVQVQHYLKVKLQTELFADNLSAKIPLQIGYAPETTHIESLYPGPSAPAEHEIAVEACPSTSTVDVDAPTIVDSQDFVHVQSRPVPVAPTQDEIPFVPAVLIDIPVEEEVVVAPMVEATATIFAASAPVEREVVEEHEDGLVVEEDDREYQAPSAPSSDESPPSLTTLLSEMLSSVDDYHLVSTKVRDRRYAEVFASVSPADFGAIVAHVNSDFDQPRVAVAVAQQVGRFLCEHCIQALRNTASWNRPAMVKSLLPYCTDLWLKSDSIINELSEWEQTVTASDFEEATRDRPPERARVH